jgi:hypothetical protein
LTACAFFKFCLCSRRHPKNSGTSETSWVSILMTKCEVVVSRVVVSRFSFRYRRDVREEQGEIFEKNLFKRWKIRQVPGGRAVKTQAG